MTKEWIISPPSDQGPAAARRWGVPALIAQLLLNRGLDPDAGVTSFLSPSLKELHPPEQLPGATAAAEVLAGAAQAGRRIILYGDYDVDGTTGVAILLHLLRAAGASVGFYVPHRIDEGYGLNREAARQLAAEGAQLIVTIDCGISAVEVAGDLAQQGVDLIITDHHAPGPQLPHAAAIVHPTVGEGYANPHLCGAGVAFKLAWLTAQRLCGATRVTPELRQLLLDLLPLAALGTVADVVPLVGENRVIARHGLAMLPETPIPGLRALIESAGLTNGRIDGYDVGFKLAPRLNAAGRMGHARLAVELLTHASPDRAREIALYLEDHNRQRQTTEARITRAALERVEQHDLASDARRAIVLAGEGWHAGVIGIAAARLVDRYHRPAALIALHNGFGQGSARSVAHFNLHAALADCAEHLETFGGHAMAAGFRIQPDRVEAFTEAFVELANRRLTGRDLAPRLNLDACVGLAELTLPTAETIRTLGPFGAGNPRPRLATEWVELAAEPRCVGRDRTHLQAEFRENGVQLKGIGFGLAGLAEDLKEYRRCRVAFEPIVSEFNGRRRVELQILDLQFPA